MPAGLHPWPSQNTASKLYLIQAGGITKHLMWGTHAAQSRTGQLKADFRYAHFPDVSLNLWKMKKDSSKMYELKNCLPLKQPQTISASNKVEVGVWLCACCWCWACLTLLVELVKPAGLVIEMDFGDPKSPQKPSPRLLPTVLHFLVFFLAPVPFSPHYPISLSLLIHLGSAELSFNSLTLVSPSASLRVSLPSHPSSPCDCFERQENTLPICMQTPSKLSQVGRETENLWRSWGRHAVSCFSVHQRESAAKSYF